MDLVHSVWPMPGVPLDNTYFGFQTQYSAVLLVCHLCAVLLNNQWDGCENTNKPESQLAYGLHSYLDS
jgi:hypothetical protein